MAVVASVAVLGADGTSTRKVLAVFSNPKSADRLTGINFSNIYKCLKGTLITTGSFNNLKIFWHYAKFI